MNLLKLKDIDPIARLVALGKLPDEEKLLFGLRPLEQEVVSEFSEEVNLTFTSLSKILAILHTLDVSFELASGSGSHVYLLGDHSVSFLADFLGVRLPDSSELPKCLDVLSSLGLIYRFSVARKFGYNDAKTNQLRINGWGREFLLAYPNEVLEVEKLNRMTSLIQKNPSYFRVFKLVSSDLRPLPTAEIHDLNESLPFAIVG